MSASLTAKRKYNSISDKSDRGDNRRCVAKGHLDVGGYDPLESVNLYAEAR